MINDIQTTGAVRIGEDGAIGSELWDGDARALLRPAGAFPARSPETSRPGNLINLNSFPADGDADILDGGGRPCAVRRAGDRAGDRPGESIENITVNGQGGNDDLSAKGGNGTGAHGRPGVPRPGSRSTYAGLRRDPDDDESPIITLDGGAGDDSCRAASAATR